ncbi:hypothetical protein ATCV1_z712R [Acanthocystis turfacea chlorella virus 1]|uniref:Uncharacterized protein z712R n=1 Tax=Chlorovirus heliozoae TaxID=322019 RepID=A7K9X2_9PHYC|nr:hypothetical protein ATCV1_z712R [Acanthocystis turfacea chlorella virus 1]ABT16846.1 hypothetical protein ATCV1_z712R [Acanthocystis turfacea chlorella virus 1]
MTERFYEFLAENRGLVEIDAVIDPICDPKSGLRRAKPKHGGALNVLHGVCMIDACQLLVVGNRGDHEQARRDHNYWYSYQCVYFICQTSIYVRSATISRISRSSWRISERDMKLWLICPRTNSSSMNGALAFAVRHHHEPRTFGNPKIDAYSRNRSFSAPGGAS